MQIIKPTSGYQAHQEQISIFLAGSIEMGLAENWQESIPTSFINKLSVSLILDEMIGIVAGVKNKQILNLITK